MKEKDKILIIEDDPSLAQLLAEVLTEEGFSTDWQEDGARGLEAAKQTLPTLILLDINLPSLSGLEICRALKGNEITQPIPIVMLTGRIAESDVVVGLELGAEDYISKPFRPKELSARLRAVLRRVRPGIKPEAPPESITIGAITMDLTRHEANLDATPLALTLTEFRLLWALASHPGKVFTREQLLERIAKGESNVVDRNIDVHVGSLRKKLGNQGSLIVTVRGVGYKCREKTDGATSISNERQVG